MPVGLTPILYYFVETEMRKTPLILSGFFIFVTLSRVSSFSASMGDESLSIAFSIGLGLTVFVASYWTQYRGNSKQSAIEADKIKATVAFSWFVLVVSVLIDGTFNLADVLATHPASTFTIIYGITPTLLSLILGILQARIDTLPNVRAGFGYQFGQAAKKKIMTVLTGQKRGQSNSRERTKTRTNDRPVEPIAAGKADTLPVYNISRKHELTAEMIAELSNGYTTAELKTMFPNQQARTLRRWKAEYKS